MIKINKVENNEVKELLKKFDKKEKRKNFSLNEKGKIILGTIILIILFMTLIILFMTWRIILNAFIWLLTWLGIIAVAPVLLYIIGIICIVSLVLSIFT